MRRRVTAVSLFSGAGGFDLGARRAGVRTLVSVESDPDAAATHRAAFPDVPLVEQDARTIDYSRWAGAHLVYGGPPCTPFSLAGGRRGGDDPRDMLPTFTAAVAAVRPRAFVWENVPGITSAEGGGYFRRAARRFARLGYACTWTTLNAMAFDLGQSRLRLFFAGFSDRQARRAFEWPEGSGERVTLADALADHRGLTHPSSVIQRRVRAWATGEEYSPIASRHPIMSWNLPARTVTANWARGGYYNLTYVPGRGLLHIGPLAAARLQGFPDDWPWRGSATSVMRQVGNAVPPPLAEAVIRAVVRPLTLL